MSLTGRLSALFLAVLAVVLAGFSTALYAAARVYLHRRVDDRLAAALSVLAAAAEVHPGDVEWEPQERVLTLGREGGDQGLLWIVSDHRGRPIDRSRDAEAVGLTETRTLPPGGADLPRRLTDRRGHTWRVAQRRVVPTATPVSTSQKASAGPGPDGAGRDDSAPSDPPEEFFPALVLTAFAPLDPTEAMLATLGWTLAGLGATTWGLSALLCRRLSRRALAPLTRMVESARGLDATDAGWSLEEAGTGDELDDLGRAFNDLLARLHLAYERQRRFSGDASHQLRTPLTVLIGQIEVALRQERPGEEYRRVLRSALGRAVQLGQIVEALLFLARAEGEAQLPGVEALDLGRWVSGHLADRCATAGAAVVTHRAVDGDGPRIRAHPPLLGQLLDNLLDNAAKHAGPGTPVVVETLREGESAVLVVEDSGPGLPAEDLPRVFEPFYRSARARLQGPPGVGLGLAVAKRIAAAFGGSIVARSGADGGCRIEVRLPFVGSQDAPTDSSVRPCHDPTAGASPWIAARPDPTRATRD